MSNGLKGALAALAASTIWGVSGIYFDVLRDVPPFEVLAHRVIWSLVFFLGLFAVTGRLGEFAGVLRRPRLVALLGLTSLLVAANWLGYIWAIQNGRATEASLGYYMFPLMSVALGYVLFRERFSRAQAIAIGLAALAVVVLTIGLSAAPWLGVFLAITFSLYGSMKKALPVGPVMSVAVEVAVLAPVVGVWLLVAGSAFGAGFLITLWLMLSVVFTGLPLVLFSYASKRLAYSSLGLLGYLNPTLQFTVAMVYFMEPFTGAHAIAFPLIWCGVALYCIDIWRQDRSARIASRS